MSVGDVVAADRQSWSLMVLLNYQTVTVGLIRRRVKLFRRGCGLCAMEYKSERKVVLFQLLFGAGETEAVTMDNCSQVK